MQSHEKNTARTAPTPSSQKPQHVPATPKGAVVVPRVVKPLG